MGIQYYFTNDEEYRFNKECISALKVRIDNLRKKLIKDNNEINEDVNIQIKRLELSTKALKYYIGI